MLKSHTSCTCTWKCCLEHTSRQLRKNAINWHTHNEAHLPKVMLKWCLFDIYSLEQFGSNTNWNTYALDRSLGKVLVPCNTAQSKASYLDSRILGPTVFKMELLELQILLWFILERSSLASRCMHTSTSTRDSSKVLFFIWWYPIKKGSWFYIFNLKTKNMILKPTV